MTTSPDPTPPTGDTPLTDEELERYRELIDMHRQYGPALSIEGEARLLAEVDRLHSWDGLMSTLDKHWPDDLFPGSYDPSRDDRARIVGLLRWVGKLVGDVESCESRVRSYESVNEHLRGEADRLRAELAAKLDAVPTPVPDLVLTPEGFQYEGQLMAVTTLSTKDRGTEQAEAEIRMIVAAEWQRRRAAAGLPALGETGGTEEDSSNDEPWLCPCGKVNFGPLGECTHAYPGEQR